MQAFRALLDQLDRVNGTNAKVSALAEHFQQAERADAAWALVLLLGKKRRRLITGRRLRDVLAEESHLPAWLIADCYGQVGDSAETSACCGRRSEMPSNRGSIPPGLASWTGTVHCTGGWRSVCRQSVS